MCQRPSFADFLPAVEEAGGAGPFAAYTATGGEPNGSRPLDDLYCLLEAYERLRVAWTEGTLVGDLA